MFLIECYRRSFKCSSKKYLRIKVIHDHWSYVHTIVDIFAPPWKSERVGLLFTHKNGSGGEISVTEQAAPHRSRKWSIPQQFFMLSLNAPPRENGCVADYSRTWSLTYRIAFLPYFGAVWTPIPAVRRASKYVVPRTGTHWDGSKYSGVRTGISCTKPSRSTAPAWCSMRVNDFCRPCRCCSYYTR